MKYPSLRSPRSFYIAGLGASAGGLEALTSFFDQLPPDSGIAFVVVQHLMPDHPSNMAMLLGRHTAMPVVQIEDGIVTEPNCVYVIPSGKWLEIYQGRLLLTEFEPDSGPRLSVDRFFRSLASDHGDRAIGIVFSGTGSDGTLGIRALKEAGGTIMAQAQETAKFKGMPASAISTGLADYILPPGEMAEALVKFVHHPLIAQPAGQQFEAMAPFLDKIAALIRSQTRIDFSGYKQNTILRRVERRMGVSQLSGPAEYLAYLQQSPKEVDALQRDLLISVTRFFRNAEAFAALREKAIAELFSRQPAGKPFRVWVPGCATGEEAYSIAMLFHEHALGGGQREVKIFATDLNAREVEFAGAGLYPKSIAADVTPEMLARYFTEEDEGYRISRAIRQSVVFARQDLLRDPPFTRLDLISCRNLLIYLQAPMQKKAFAFFHFSLLPGGYLFLGISETIGDRQAAFGTVDARARIYRKREDSPPQVATETVRALGIMDSNTPVPLGNTSRAARERSQTVERLKERLFAAFVPTCVAVNDKREIVHSFGRPERYLSLQAGRATLDVLKLAPRPLSLALSSALRRAAKTQEIVFIPGIRTATNITVDIKVEPLPADRDQPALLLVFFEERRAGRNAGGTPDNGGADIAHESAEHILHLEEDLLSATANLQDAIEDKETTNEELQAANEELLAANEELQSSNEELESLNEELTTLNSEYQRNIAELTLSTNDLENFLRTSDIATVFLDSGFRIRRFTPTAARELRLLPQDTGRLLTDLRNPVIDAIAKRLPLVGVSGSEMESVETSPGVWHLLRLIPYRREGASDSGIVIVVLDITALEERTRGQHRQ